MDKNKNIFQLENRKDESYIKLELDISALDGLQDGRAKLNVYRVGYKDTDTPSKPVKTFEIAPDVINNSNKNAEHVVGFGSAFGEVAFTIDGKTALKSVDREPEAGGPPPPFGRRRKNAVNLNPMGQGGNFIPFGMLCDMASPDPGQRATFREVTVSDHRKPNNTLFLEDLKDGNYKGIYADSAGQGSGFSVINGNYSLNGGSKGVFVVRDPSRNAAPMLRSAFKVSTKPIAAARLYVTSRGIYEFYVNGARVGTDCRSSQPGSPWSVQRTTFKASLYTEGRRTATSVGHHGTGGQNRPAGRGGSSTRFMRSTSRASPMGSVRAAARIRRWTRLQWDWNGRR